MSRLDLLHMFGRLDVHGPGFYRIHFVHCILAKSSCNIFSSAVLVPVDFVTLCVLCAKRC